MTINTDALRVVAKFVGAANSSRDVCEFGERCDAFIEEAREVLSASPQAPAQPASKAERVHAIVNDGPFPGVSEAFDAHMGAACWTDPAYRQDAATWAAAWKAALRQNDAPAAQAAPRQLHSFSSIDCEALIAECVPGGSICDPQQVADSIRRYLNAWPGAQAEQADRFAPEDEALIRRAVAYYSRASDASTEEKSRAYAIFQVLRMESASPPARPSTAATKALARPAAPAS